MDKNLQEEIMMYLNTIKYGEIGIVLNESIDYVDETVTWRKRFPKNNKKEIIEYLDTIRWGDVKIILNESLKHIDITVTRYKEFSKKNKKKYDKSNVKHEG